MLLEGSLLRMEWKSWTQTELYKLEVVCTHYTGLGNVCFSSILGISKLKNSYGVDNVSRLSLYSSLSCLQKMPKYFSYEPKVYGLYFSLLNNIFKCSNTFIEMSTQWWSFHCHNSSSSHNNLIQFLWNENFYFLIFWLYWHFYF